MYEQVVDLVRRCGDELVGKAGNIDDIGVKKQSLTEQDIGIEQAITVLVKSFGSDHLVFAEELSDQYVAGDNVWIIDPISCTYNYLHGLPHYAVVVSHLHYGEVDFAVVYDPSMKELFCSERGKGVWLNEQPVKVNHKQNDLCYLFDSHSSDVAQRKKNILLLDELFDQARIRNVGSFGLQYAYVACGRVEAAVSLNKDVYPEFAGQLLVEEAGGKFTDFGGQPLTIDTRCVVASNGLVHEQILGTVGSYRR